MFTFKKVFNNDCEDIYMVESNEGNFSLMESLLGMSIYNSPDGIFVVAEEISNKVIEQFDTLASAREYIREMVF